MPLPLFPKASSMAESGAAAHAEEIARFARHHLADQLHRPGSCLYSAASTVAPGEVYVLGFNPGGTGGPPLGADLASMARRSKNAYLDEEWAPGGRIHSAGSAPMQQSVQTLLTALGFDPRSVLATNLIFFQSRDATGVSYRTDADKCWPVHERMLSLVRPSLIIALGNGRGSAYSYLRQTLRGGEQAELPAGHGSWKFRRCWVDSPAGRAQLLGVPHSGRYRMQRVAELYHWLQEAGRAPASALADCV